MDKRYLREWTSLIPEPPAYFGLDNESNKSKTNEYGAKASKLSKKSSRKGKSTTPDSASSFPSPTSSFSECINIKQGKPLLKNKIKNMKVDDNMSNDTKSVFRNINNKSKSYDNPNSKVNIKQMKKAAEGREFNPPKFSTPSKNLGIFHDSPKMSSTKEGKKGPGPASKKLKSPRSLVYSPRALQKKLTSFQKSQPGANIFKVSHTDKIKYDIGNTYSHSNLPMKMKSIQKSQPVANDFRLNKTDMFNSAISKVCSDQRIVKKFQKSKSSSLRNLRYKASPSPSSTPTSPSTSETETSDDDSDISDNGDTFSNKNVIPEKLYKETGYEQQVSRQTGSKTLMGLYQSDERISEEDLDYLTETGTLSKNRYSSKELDTKKNKSKSCMVKENNQPIQNSNLPSKEINSDIKKKNDVNNQPIQLQKSRYSNEERQFRLVDDVSFSKKIVSQKSVNTEELKKVETFTKAKIVQPQSLIEKNSNKNAMSPQKKRKSMSETSQQINTIPSKKFVKENIFREFNSGFIKGGVVTVTKNNFEVNNKDKGSKKRSKDKSSFVSESDDHGELNSSGYMSKTSQDRTYEDERNNSTCPATRESVDPNKYINLFFKDDKKINRNVLKRNSRVLGEAIEIINKSNITLGLGMKKNKDVIDNYLNDPNYDLSLLNSKIDMMKSTPNKKMKFQNESPFTSSSCELEQVEITMTVGRSDQPKYSVDKSKVLSSCTISKDTIKEIKHQNMNTDSSPGERVQKDKNSYKYKELNNVSKKNIEKKMKSPTDYDLNLERKNLNSGKSVDKICSIQRNPESVDKDTQFFKNTSKGKSETISSALITNTNSSTSEESSESSLSDRSSSDDEEVANELLDGERKIKTSQLNETIISNDIEVNPKYPLKDMDDIDISKKSNKLADNILSDLNLSSESSEDEECLNNSMNMRNIKESRHNECLSESNSGNVTKKGYSNIGSVEKDEDLKNRRTVSIENDDDLRITIHEKNKGLLDKCNQKKILDQDGIVNSSQNLGLACNSDELLDETMAKTYSKNSNSIYNLPWTSTLSDDLAISVKRSPPTSTRKHRISWNKRKEWDNDFQEKADELDDGCYIEDMGNEKKIASDLSEEEEVLEQIKDKENKEYDTELDYEVDEISEEEEEKETQTQKDLTSFMQRMKSNKEVYNSFEGDNAADSERLNQDEDVLSIHADSLFSQDDDNDCGDDKNYDLRINDLRANSTILLNVTTQDSAIQKKTIIQDNSEVEITNNLHTFEENAEFENIVDKNEVSRQELVPLWEGMLSPQAELAEFNLAAFPVSGNTHLFTENLANEIEVSALVEKHMVHNYLDGRNSKSLKDFVIVKFEPVGSEDIQSYQDFLLYLLVNKQYAVIGNCHRRVKHFYVVPLPAQQTVPEVFLPLDGPGLKPCNYHLLIGIMIFSKQCAQGKNGNTNKLTSKGIPFINEDKKTIQGDNSAIQTLKKNVKPKDKDIIKEKEYVNNTQSVTYQVPYESKMDDRNAYVNGNYDTYQVQYESTMDDRKAHVNTGYYDKFQVPYNPEMDDLNVFEKVNSKDYVSELEFMSHLNERYNQELYGSIAPEFYLNNDVSPTETLSLLSNLIQVALAEKEEERAWDLFDRYVSNHPNIPSLGLEAMIPIARLILTSDVVLDVPENIKHYLAGAKIVVLCEISKGDEAYALFRDCYLYLPVTIKQTVTYSFIRFCGNHKVDDNESPWTKVQNWELENPSCILTEHQKAVKLLLESTWLEFHIDSKNAEKVWNIFMSLCSEMQKYSYFFKKITIMVIDFFNDIGQAKLSFCVLDEVRRLQAADVEIFTPLIPLIFEPNISINFSSELTFTCEIIIELGVVLSQYDIEGLMKFCALIDKVDVALKLALFGIKLSIFIDITIIEEVVRRFDYMAHSLGKLYELLKLLNYANLRFLKPSLNMVLNPKGHSRSFLNFHQNKLISNIQEYYREHVFMSLKGDECQITPTKNNDKQSSLHLKSPQDDDDDQKSLKERKCSKSPTKSTIKKLQTTGNLDKFAESKKIIESNYPQALIMNSISSIEIDNQSDKIIKDHTDKSFSTSDTNNRLEKKDKVCSSSIICKEVPYPIVSKSPSIDVESVFTSLSETKGVELIKLSSLEQKEREKILKEWHVCEYTDEDDLQKNKLAGVSCNAEKHDLFTKSNSNLSLEEKEVLESLSTPASSSKIQNDERDQQFSINAETHHIKSFTQTENYPHEKHATSLEKNSTINDTNQISVYDELKNFKSKDIPIKISQLKEQRPFDQEKLSPPLSKYSPMTHLKQSLKEAISKSLISKIKGNENLQTKKCGNQEHFLSPFGKRKIMKRTYSNFEQIKRQSSISENSQLQGLSVTVEIPHNESEYSKRSVFIDDKDGQITSHPPNSNKDSISTDKIAQRAFEILNKKRLLRNLPKHITPSQIVTKYQDQTMGTYYKSPEYEKEKVNILEHTSNNENQVKYSRDPRINKKIQFEEYKIEHCNQIDSNKKNIQHKQEETDSNELELLNENINNDDNLNDLSIISAVSSVGSTPPLEIDEELESPTIEKINLEPSNAEKTDIESSTDEKMDLESPTTQKINLESPPAEKINLESPTAEKSDLESPTAKKIYLESPTAKKIYLESPTAKKIDLESPAAKKIDLESPAAKKIDLESPAAKKMDLESPSAKKMDLESPTAKKIDLESPTAKKIDLESPTAKKIDLESPTAKKIDLESPTAKKKNLEPPTD